MNLSRSIVLAACLALLPALAVAHSNPLPMASASMQSYQRSIVSTFSAYERVCEQATWGYQRQAQVELDQARRMLRAKRRLLRERQDMASIMRRLDALSYVDPDLLEKLNRIYKELREVHGYTVMPVETFRSPQRQASLLATGGGVTTVAAMRSCHQYGLAVDSVVFRRGVPQWDVDDPWVMRGYQLFGALVIREGLTWGGTWTDPRDYGHVEKREECQAAIASAPQYFATLSARLAFR